MRHLSLALILTGLFTAGSADRLAAQRPRPHLEVARDSAGVFEITLADGTTLIGRIVALDAAGATIRTVGGLEVTVRPSDVVGVRPISGSVNAGEFWEDDLSDSRLFLGPTARVPRSGRGYFGVYELFFASGGVGIGDVAMISGGMSLVPFIAFEEQVFYVAPKVRLVNLPGVQAAAGMFWVKPGVTEGSAGLVFGTVTGGTATSAVTVGVGYPFASEGGFAEDPLVMLGGEVRLARGFKFISENWIAPGADGALLSLGVRFLTRRLTVEVGAVTSTDGGFLPLVSFSGAW